jgi:hypothetical protein
VKKIRDFFYKIKIIPSDSDRSEEYFVILAQLLSYPGRISNICLFLSEAMSVNVYIKANRKGSRDAELSFEHGWKSTHKIHPSKKTYTRKSKHKREPDFPSPGV